jgi:hypothetical protein
MKAAAALVAQWRREIENNRVMAVAGENISAMAAAACRQWRSGQRKYGISASALQSVAKQYQWRNGIRKHGSGISQRRHRGGMAKTRIS